MGTVIMVIAVVERIQVLKEVLEGVVIYQVINALEVLIETEIIIVIVVGRMVISAIWQVMGIIN